MVYARNAVPVQGIAFGNRLRVWRWENKAPIETLATDIDVADSRLNAWEKGVRFPSGKHLDLLAKYMGLPVVALLYHADGMPPERGDPARRQ